MIIYHSGDCIPKFAPECQIPGRACIMLTYWLNRKRLDRRFRLLVKDRRKGK